MATITRIKLQKNRQRANIFTDGKFLLALPVETIAKKNLRIGQVISEEELEVLGFDNEYHKFLDIAYGLISRRPRSKAEIERHLHGKHVSEKVCLKVINKLEEMGYLDDENFSRWWLEQRQTFRQKGKLALKAELRQKGVDEETIKRVLEKEVDEELLAKEAANKKMTAFNKLAAREFHQKMFAFLARKGFSMETIKKVLDEIQKKE